MAQVDVKPETRAGCNCLELTTHGDTGRPATKPINQARPQPPLIGRWLAVNPATLNHSTTTTTNNNDKQNSSSQKRELGASLEELIRLLGKLGPRARRSSIPAEPARRHAHQPLVNLSAAFGELTATQANANNENQFSNPGPRIRIVRGAPAMLPSTCTRPIRPESFCEQTTSDGQQLGLEETIENTMPSRQAHDNSEPANHPNWTGALGRVCLPVCQSHVVKSVDKLKGSQYR